MALNTAKILALKPDNRDYKVFDSQGLFMIVKKTGKRWWRFKYRFKGKEQTLSLGVYPDISLKDARLKRDEYRKILTEDINPADLRKEIKAEQKGENLFETIALQWHQMKEDEWSTKYADMVLSSLRRNIFPYVKNKHINDIKPTEMLEILKKLESRGKIETTKRIKQTCGQIFRYGVALGKCERDPTRDIGDALKAVKSTPYAFLSHPDDIARLLKDIDQYHGHFIIKCALMLAPLVFLRPTELAQGEWQEVDFDKSEWHIAEHRMKMRQKHIVPLSRQAMNIIKGLRLCTNTSRFMFPSRSDDDKPMSSESLRMALRRMGYSTEEVTTHGFRHMASTRLHEMASDFGWHSDVIERQLAHAERNKIKAAYNHAEYLVERRRMMQVWADYLDSLKFGTNVVNLDSKQA
ncbi:tyrosine-type recombinase/integrase [Thiotrichales bacterium 19S9-12]|nr:tyrosine-type recombinase/integrase [Thiotrichales bacterium 19S9-11]MCF6811847.1 tyrosine-type recombinase/integrase [Thiotrichales bacterium 19S9-12]